MDILELHEAARSLTVDRVLPPLVVGVPFTALGLIKLWGLHRGMIGGAVAVVSAVSMCSIRSICWEHIRPRADPESFAHDNSSECCLALTMCKPKKRLAENGDVASWR
jgi:hypothetical protein